MDRQDHINHIGNLLLTDPADGRPMEIRGDLKPVKDGEEGFSFIVGAIDYSTEQSGTKYKITVQIEEI